MNKQNEVTAAMERIKELAPIAKRSPDAAARDEANKGLIECYATLAALQASGISTPTIDMGAL